MEKAAAKAMVRDNEQDEYYAETTSNAMTKSNLKFVLCLNAQAGPSGRHGRVVQLDVPRNQEVGLELEIVIKQRLDPSGVLVMLTL